MQAVTTNFLRNSPDTGPCLDVPVPGLSSGLSYGVSVSQVHSPVRPFTGRAVLTLLGALVFLTMMIATLPAVAAPKRIVVLGDSLSAGYQLSAAAAFPAVLERRMRERGYDITVINAGVSGDTANGGLSRLDWAVGDGADLVIVELGANDMLRGIDPAETRKALDQIVARLQARKITVLLAGMVSAPNMGPEFAARFNALFGDIASKRGVALYPFFLEGVAAQRELNLPDGMHPNAAGVEEIVRRILPLVVKLVEQTNAAGK